MELSVTLAYAGAPAVAKRKEEGVRLGILAARITRPSKDSAVEHPCCQNCQPETSPYITDGRHQIFSYLRSKKAMKRQLLSELIGRKKATWKLSKKAMKEAIALGNLI